jgi:Ca-activated chloride channel family protein
MSLEFVPRVKFQTIAVQMMRYRTCSNVEQLAWFGEREWDMQVSRAFILIVAALLVGWPSAARAQVTTFKSSTELVNLNVTVTDAAAKPVTGLTADRFQIFEDGVPQNVQFFAPGDMPLDVVILLDTSASMTGSMPLIQQAATRFARALRTTDRASVMGISSGLRVLQEITGDFDAVERAIRGSKAAGRTPLYASIYTALRELDKLREQATTPRRQAIVVLSDGQDTASLFGFNELLEAVRRSAVPIYTISPRPTKTIMAQRESIFGETTRTQDFEMRKLAAETGARAFFPVQIHELTGVYDDIANELAHQYSLGYQSTNAQRDGGFRRIALKIDVPGARWRARTGYVADGPRAGDDDDQR